MVLISSSNSRIKIETYRYKKKRMMNKMINIFRQFYNEFIYGAHLTALIGPSIIIIPIVFLDLPVNTIALLIAYLIPLIVYSYDYQKEIDKDAQTNSEKSKYLYKRKRVFPLIFSIYLFLTIILITTIFDINFFIFLLIVLTGGILYTTIFKRLSKNIPAFKNIYTTAIWAYFGTFFVIFLYKIFPNSLLLVLFIFTYLKILINNVFFDIKDISADKNEGLKTLPIILGKANTIYLLSALNVIALLILLCSVYFEVVPFFGISLSLFFFYTQYYLIKGLTVENKMLLNYTYIISEAEFGLWPIVLIISKTFINYI